MYKRVIFLTKGNENKQARWEWREGKRLWTIRNESSKQGEGKRKPRKERKGSAVSQLTNNQTNQISA